MGYTGEGLDKERAHVHLELNLLLSSRFESWYESFVKNDPNRHGIYNGINLTGLDIARLYLALRENPVADHSGISRARRSLLQSDAAGDARISICCSVIRGCCAAREKSAPSWEVSFNRAGVPLQVEAPRQRRVRRPCPM